MYDDLKERLARLLPTLIALVAVAVIGWLLAIVAAERFPNTHGLTIFLAMAGGGIVGLTEIANRYRDDPMVAVLSPPGLGYVGLNAALSAAALMLLFRYPSVFGPVGKDGLAAALAAGFGASALMRTKVALVKGPDNKDVAFGPDVAIAALLKLSDKYLDRRQARMRQGLVVRYLPKMKAMGSFKGAYRYLLVSLLALQNLDEDTKKGLNTAVEGIEAQNLPDDVKYMALGFLFLTIVGQGNFEGILADASKVTV